MLSADWSDGVQWGPIGSDGVPMGSDWVISHTGVTGLQHSELYRFGRFAT